MSWCSLRARTDPSATPSGWAAAAADAFDGLLWGLGVLSACFFVLAHLGRLSTAGIGASIGAVATVGVIVCHRRGVLRRALEGLPRTVGLAVTLAAGSIVFGWLLPPFDTTIAGSDSSVYLGTAHHLARHGTIRHRDPLVAGMTAIERTTLLLNRFEADNTGRYVRFPGGVPLLSPSSDVVTFGFYHLFPIWLAVGLKTAGGGSGLWMMSLWGCISLLSLFLVGRSLGGAGLGLLACLLHASFFPQVFFSRFASSELLAQALFLSGLYALLRGLRAHGGRHLCLSGVLWGALCLCRVDGLPLLWLGLTTMAVLSTRLGLRTRVWAVPMVLTLLFGSMAVYHQLSNGVYLGPLGDSPLAAPARVALAERPWLSIAALVILVGAGSAASLCGSSRGCRTRLTTALRRSSLIPAAIILGFFASRLDGELLARHVQWIFLYVAPPVLLVLCAGLLVASVRAFQGCGTPALGVVLALFVGPAACYLVDPLVLPLQPWAMRRFLPMISPLFLVLSLYGWREIGRRLPGQIWLRKAAVGGIAVVTAGLLLRSAAGLAGPDAGPDVVSQVKALARTIPGDGLVIIPDSNAGLQLQIPLRFVGERDVLLLPLTRGSGRRTDQVLRRFLTRQLETGRRVFLLLGGSTDLGGLLAQHYRLDFLGEVPLTWEQPHFMSHDVLPPPPQVARLRSRVVEVGRARGSPGPGRITIGDVREDVSVLVGGFHEAEIEARPGRPAVPYRWTGRVATMALPPTTSMVLTIDVWRPPRARPAAVRVRVDGVSVSPPPSDSPGRQVLRVPFPETDDATRKRIVTIECDTFNPRDLGLSEDGRELGVRVLSVEIESP